MTRKPARSTGPGVDPRVAGWAESALERASLHLDLVDDLTGEITRHVNALAREQIVTDRGLIPQVVVACHAAIALVLVTDYHRKVFRDPADVADPAVTSAAVAREFANVPRPLRPFLAHTAAARIAVDSAAVD
jgi:hypothetical protein